MISELSHSSERPEIQIDLRKIEDTNTRIVAGLYNIGQPARQSDIVRETGVSPQLIDYHIKILISKGVVYIVEDDEGCKYYVLSSVFYDESLFEGLCNALYPLADAVAETINVDETSVVVENSKYLAELFWTLLLSKKYRSTYIANVHTSIK